jgi:hypothetical protein
LIVGEVSGELQLSLFHQARPGAEVDHNRLLGPRLLDGRQGFLRRSPVSAEGHVLLAVLPDLVLLFSSMSLLAGPVEVDVGVDDLGIHYSFKQWALYDKVIAVPMPRLNRSRADRDHHGIR